MGFFNLGPMPSSEPKNRKTRLQGCDACGLSRVGLHRGAVGAGASHVLVVGDYPPENESPDEIYSSPVWHYFWDTEGKKGLPPDYLQACWLTYAVACPCPDKDATAARSLCCQGRLERIIQELQPRVIIPLGPVATQALVWGRLQGRIKNVKPSDFYGKAIPDRTYNCWLCPTYDPTFLSWQKNDICPEKYFIQHLRKAFTLAQKPLPKIPDDLRTTLDPVEAVQWIKEAVAEALPARKGTRPDVAIDYETTGLKPHREGHRIVASSLAWRGPRGYKAIGFKWDPDCPALISAWEDLISGKDGVGLIAHKADFEACWTHFRAGLHSSMTIWPEHWSWDTCIGAHVLNNNQKVGLKFHTYCELGVLGYDSAADHWLSQFLPGENPDSCNALNMLASPSGSVPWGELVYYCGQDSLYTLALRDIQENQMVGREPEAFRFFMQGMLALAKVQSEGLPIDMDKVQGLRQDLTARYEAAKKEVMRSREAQEFKRVMDTQLNPDSNQQLVKLLFDILKLTPPDGARNTREDTLEKLGTDFCKSILAMRRWSKMRDTFLEGYVREAVWDEPKQQWLIRPFFNLAAGAGGDGDGGPRTYRSSADSPNFQNIPKRDKEAKKLLRSLFVAPPGWRYIEADYKSLEVMVSASYHHDPNMIRYLNDPESDMHRDTAADMYMRKPEDITKDERTSIKAGYVFSSFYGASYKSCALTMWNSMPQTTKDHLRQRGIKTLDQFTEHVRKADWIFWNRRFGTYNRWRHEEWDRYQKDGYVESYTGFRCYGPMTYTEATNRCIQGSGFHVLLQALIWDVSDFDKQYLQSYIVGQIHDALLILAKDNELKQVQEIVHHNGVRRVSHVFPWIAVPLVIEADASEPGGSWASMTEQGAW